MIEWLRRLLGGPETQTDQAVTKANETVARVDRVSDEFWEIQRRMKPPDRRPKGGPRVP